MSNDIIAENGHNSISNDVPPPEVLAHCPYKLPPQFDHMRAFRELTAHLWRGGQWAYWWTATVAQHPEGHRRKGQAKEMTSVFFRPDNPAPFPAESALHGWRKLYFGVNPTASAEPSPYRAKNSTIDVVNCLCGEIDLKDHEYNWATLWQAVERLHLAPSVIIYSGGGLHLYWLFSRTYRITVDMIDLSPEDYQYVDPDERGSKIIRKQNADKFTRIQWLQHKWIETQPQLDQYAKALTQVLRIVGSYNYKKKYAPAYPEVLFVKCDLDLRYTIPQLEQFLPQATPPTSASASPYRRVDEQEEIDRASNLVNLLDPDCGRFEWLYVASCLKGQFDDAGFDIWHQWSARSKTKYKEGEPSKLWPNLKRFENGLGRIIGMLSKRNLLPEIPIEKRKRAWEYRESDEELEVSWARVKSTLKGEVQRGVGGGKGQARPLEINDRLLDIFCPTRSPDAYAHAKPDGTLAAAKNPLTADELRVAFNRRKTVRVRINGKRKMIVKSIVADPTDAHGWTRVIALGVSAAHLTATMDALVELGLDSFAFKWSIIKNVDKTVPFAIPLYNIERTNRHLEKMAITPILSTFFDVKYIEIEYFVVVMTADLIPAEWGIFLICHLILAKYLPSAPLPSGLCLPIPGQASPISPKAYEPFIRPDGRTIATNVIYHAWSQLLDEYQFPTWQNLIFMWGKVSRFQKPELKRGKSHEVGDSVESVARWFNRRHDLDQFGIELPDDKNVTECPWCGDCMLLWPRDGYHVAACRCDTNLITPFVAQAKWYDISLETLAEWVRQEYDLGQAGQHHVEGLSEQQIQRLVEGVGEILEETSSREQQQVQENVAQHLVKNIEEGRQQIKQLAFNLNPGVTTIVAASAGLGKSHIFQEFTARARFLNIPLNIFTDTRQLSQDWSDGLTSWNSAHQIYQTVEQICTCYTVEQKRAIIRAGWQIKHAKPCPYVQQHRQIGNRKEGQTWIFRHANLHHNFVQGAQINICDESIVQALLPELKADLYRDVLRLLNLMEERNEPKEVKVLIETMFDFAQKAYLAPYAYIKGVAFLKYFSTHVSDITMQDAIKALENSPYNKPNVLVLDKPEREQAENRDASDDGQPLQQDLSNLRKRWIPSFLVALKQTIKNPVHATFHLLQQAKEATYSKLVYVWYIKRPFFSGQLGKMPTVRNAILDASAIKEIYEALLAPWPIEFHKIKVPPSPIAKFSQITGLNLTRNALRDPKHFCNTINKIAHIANQEGWLFESVITHKEFKEQVAHAFGIDEHMTLHYRNQRGSNLLKDSTCALTFADPTIPTGAIERMTDALYSHDDQPFERWPNGKLWKKQGRIWASKDKRLQVVGYFAQSAELLQGVERPRNALAEIPKHNVHAGNFKLSEMVKAEVRIIDASKLHANRKEVRNALKVYEDRLWAARRASDS